MLPHNIQLYVHFSGDDGMRCRRRLHKRKIIILALFSVLLYFLVGYDDFRMNVNMNVKGNLKDKSRTIKDVFSTATKIFVLTFKEKI